MPSILPPISLPLLIHTRPIPIPHTFRSHPTHLLPPSHSPSVCSPLSFRPHPTPPSPLLIELVHLLPCLLSPPTCSLVHSSTRQLIMLLIELVHLLPCLLQQITCSLVPLLTRLLVNYFYHLTFLSVLVQNTATLILPFLSPLFNIEMITISKTSY